MTCPELERLRAECERLRAALADCDEWLDKSRRQAVEEAVKCDRMRAVVVECALWFEAAFGPANEMLAKCRDALDKDSRGGVGGEVPSGGTPGWSPGGAGSNPVVTTPALGSLREAARDVLAHWLGLPVTKRQEWYPRMHRLRAALAAEPDCPPAASAVDRTYQKLGGTDLQRANLRGANLQGAALLDSDLLDSDLLDSDLQGEEREEL